MDIRRVVLALQATRFFWGICCGLLILNLVFYFGFIRKQNSRIHELQGIYAQKRGAKFTPGDPRTKSYLRAKEDIQVFRDRLSPKTSFAETVRELYDLLRKRGLGVSKMIYQPEPFEALELWKYTTSFTVTGSYAQLKGLLADIQSSRGLFCIESLSFTDRTRDAEQIDMSLKIGMYFR
jgi:hypothetical protein